jgi:hypothetical protein
MTPTSLVEALGVAAIFRDNDVQEIIGSSEIPPLEIDHYLACCYRSISDKK